VSVHHFGAFTDAAWRENDYLWGRLDAAELILCMLRHDIASPGAEVTLSTAEQAIELVGRQQLQSVLQAIMNAEEGLQRIPETVMHVRTCINEMGARRPLSM